MSEKSGREKDGKFAKGNPGGPGNPYARKTAALRKAAADFATEDQVRVLLAAMFLKGQQGDVAAARLFLSYAVGKPGPGADPDTLDAHEFDVQRQTAEAAEQLRAAPPAPAPEPRRDGPSPSYATALRGVFEALQPALPSPVHRPSSASAPADADRPPTTPIAPASESDGGRLPPLANGKSGPAGQRPAATSGP